MEIELFTMPSTSAQVFSLPRLRGRAGWGKQPRLWRYNQSLPAISPTPPSPAPQAGEGKSVGG